MKHIKELKLNEEISTGYEASTFADITTENIIYELTRQLKDDGCEERFFVRPEVKRYLSNHAKEMMSIFWDEIKDKEKLKKLENNLERAAEGPDHPFHPMGVFPDPSKK